MRKAVPDQDDVGWLELSFQTVRQSAVVAATALHISEIDDRAGVQHHNGRERGGHNEPRASERTNSHGQHNEQVWHEDERTARYERWAYDRKRKHHGPWQQSEPDVQRLR
jgi:hypothetical protein